MRAMSCKPYVRTAGGSCYETAGCPSLHTINSASADPHILKLCPLDPPPLTDQFYDSRAKLYFIIRSLREIALGPRQCFNTRHAWRFDTCNLRCTCTIASRRRAGHSPVPNSSSVWLGPPASPHIPAFSDSTSVHRYPVSGRRPGPPPLCRTQFPPSVNAQ